MDDWLNLRGDSSGKQKSLRGPLLLLAILVMIVVAFFLIYKAGQAKLKTQKPSGQVKTELSFLAQNPSGRVGTELSLLAQKPSGQVKTELSLLAQTNRAHRI
ncbi:MAG: hypothetical protein LBF38_11920 [Deltaproteobacteria bacterium]|jgi:uncharacterized membrane protein|nr:hypothetical protein [Deltaproteobacteria bacterium]